MATSQYNLDIQRMSSLDAVYKALYLLNAMGQWSKDEQIRDDLSVRMAQMANKFSIKNPSEVNKTYLEAIQGLAGDYDDPLVITPFAKSLGKIGGAIVKASEKREKTVDEFHVAKDKILDLQNFAARGYYNTTPGSEALDTVMRKVNKNANLFDTGTRLLISDEYKELQQSINAMKLMESLDLLDKANKEGDREMKVDPETGKVISKQERGIQVDPNLLPNVPMGDKSLRSAIDIAEVHIAGGRWPEAMEAIENFEKENRMLFSKELGKEFDLLKASMGSVEQTTKQFSSGLKDEKAIKTLMSGITNVHNNFISMDAGRMANPGVWARQYDDLTTALIGFASQIYGPAEKWNHNMLTEENIKKLQRDITGEGAFAEGSGEWEFFGLNLRAFGDESDLTSDAVYKVWRYLEDLDMRYNKLFGSSLKKEHQVMDIVIPKGWSPNMLQSS